MHTQSKGKEFLSQLKLYSDYLKWNNQKNRYETWEEAVDSVLNTHILKYGEKVRKYIEEIRLPYLNKEFLVSQRNLQFRGESILRNNARIYNCCTTYAYSPDVFNKGFWVLLSGTGLGVHLGKKYVSQLPRLHARRQPGAKNLVIEDSIEGWANALKALISSYCKHPSLMKEYFGYQIKFDYSQIRPKGAYISGGFKAPGPDGLKNALEKIETLINNYLGNAESKEFSSIIAYDILMHSSDAVLSGGVRRSAMLVLIDEDDEEMIKAKTGNWRIENPQRARSNNSVWLKRGTFSKERFKELLAINNGDNDLGFVLVDHEDEITNPCAEIGFNFYEKIKSYTHSAYQFCVSGDTKLITKDGITTIKEAVGKEIEIWNGKEWSVVKPYKTGDKDRLHRVFFGDGSYLDATDNHKFLVKNRFEKTYREVETIGLINLLKTEKYTLHVPRANIVYSGGTSNDEAYNYGFILGDGFIPKKSNKVYASLYGAKKEIKFDNVRFVGNYKNYNGTDYTTIEFEKVDTDFCRKLKYEDGLPETIFSWDKESIIQFISGWADADGSQASKGIRIYGNEQKLREGQLLLTKVGINSSINLASKKGHKTNLCERKNDIWCLQISETKELKTRRLKTSDNKPKAKGLFQTIVAIYTLEGEHESYCLTEEKLHQCVFNNVLTKQCNLTELNASAYKDARGNLDVEKFYRGCRVGAIAGTLQAGYTDFPYLGKETEEIVAGEALLGVSITGWMTNPQLFNPEVLRKGAQIVVETNREVAAFLGINPSARTTTTKPSGNASVILGTTSGIHPDHARRYFRIMQLNKESETAKWLAENMPEVLEESVWSTNNTDYAVFTPIENSPDTIVKEQMTGVKHLELIKLVKENWVDAGKVKELCYNPSTSHNVSNTVIIDDMEQITDYIYDNMNSFAAVSFITAYGDKDYNQAPFTSVLDTKELIEKYGDGVIFMSGLIVDGLHYFNGNLWEATDYVLNKDRKIVGTREQVLLRKDWIRRVHKFAKNYFKKDLQKTIYCMKDVHLWHKWNLINRNFKVPDFTEILKKPVYSDIDKYSAVACSGGACEVNLQ